ncbi:hypothetical protein D3C78_1622310 [compost metagenome]
MSNIPAVAKRKFDASAEPRSLEVGSLLQDISLTRMFCSLNSAITANIDVIPSIKEYLPKSSGSKNLAIIKFVSITFEPSSALAVRANI